MQNTLNDIRTLDLVNGDPNELREKIRNYFIATWELDEKLYSQLNSDAVFYKRGDSLRHIILFYVGHTAVFFINKLILSKLIEKRINPFFESIFAIGVDEMSWDDLDNNNYDWPPLDDVWDYRNKVKSVILDLIDNLPLQTPINWENPFWIIMMGIEHERIHIETSSVLIRQLPIEDVRSQEFGRICSIDSEVPLNSFVAIDAKELKLGKNENHFFYGWDNEYGTHKEHVKDFKISQMLISNRDFLSFVDAGAYDIQKYWTEEGWDWRTYKNAKMPLFWHKSTDGYKLRLVAEIIDMPWSWPVEVNYLEAKAYANWKSEQTGVNLRLPTEAEWYLMYEKAGLTDVDSWGKTPGNIQLSYFSSPCPVNYFAQGDFYDVVGNVWQWTETPITGFQGFKVHPMYDDFSTPTFDGKHNIIKGGSWISTGNEATYHARYAFRRHFYQHAGFRLVESEYPLVVHQDVYEKDYEVAGSCENMWGVSDCLNFSIRLSQFIKEKIGELSSMSILDLNCDTGRLSYELALEAKSVLGIDFSARFIRVPIHMQKSGFLRYQFQDENDLVLYKDVVLPAKYAHVKSNLQFMQDNPNNLKSIYTSYDLIVAVRVLEELTDPLSFLVEIDKRLNENGYLLLANDYDWSNLEANKRPGGFKKDGEPVSSFDSIKNILDRKFELISERITLPLYEKINSRKTIISDLEISLWKLKKII